MLLVFARAASVASLLSAFGTLVFQVTVMTRVAGGTPAPGVSGRLLALARASAGAGLVALAGWLAAQSADMAGSVAGLPTVLAATAFGHLWGAQFAALLAGGVVLWRWPDRPGWALGFVAAATLLQAGHGHAASMYAGPSLLLVASAVHLAGAGAWLGGLLPLLIVVHGTGPAVGAQAARWFSPLGKACLWALAGSALFQGWVLTGSVAGLVGTDFGGVEMVKLALFGVLFGFAAVNRYRFAPALRGADPGRARRALVGSIAVQTGFGLAVVAAAAMLTSLPPAMHEQPLWPFAERLTWDILGEDPDLRCEVLAALAELAGGAVLLVAAALVRHRVRWLAAGAAVVLVAGAVPHLDLLFVPAYPTSYYRSPTGFAAASIVQGAALYPAHCASCHGVGGQGDGPLARGLPVPPADLTAAHLWMHEDGELFWWLTHGIDGPEGGLAMPGFAAMLSADERWALIDFVRAHNAGLVFHDTGAWSPPVQAPDVSATCPGGRGVTLADLRGGFVRVVFGPGATVLVTTAGERCLVADETVAAGYGVVAGVQEDALVGAQFLIDGDGWLRAEQVPGVAPGWDDAAVLAGAVRRFAAQPLATVARGPMRM